MELYDVAVLMGVGASGDDGIALGRPTHELTVPDEEAPWIFSTFPGIIDAYASRSCHFIDAFSRCKVKRASDNVDTIEFASDVESNA